MSPYRPFAKEFLYFDDRLNERRGKIPGFFPTSESQNIVITLSGVGHRGKFSALITNLPPSYNYADMDNCQCFPLRIFDDSGDVQDADLFQSDANQTHDGIFDEGLKHFRSAYDHHGDSITKEDLFYYIYGLLHSPEYRERYKDNLRKELPRIPAVKKFEDFQAFSRAGRDLAHWHLDYETVDCHGVTLDVCSTAFRLNEKRKNNAPPAKAGTTNSVTVQAEGIAAIEELKKLTNEHFYVRKMKFPGVKDPETRKRVKDKTTIIYNEYITVRDIPLEAYGYVVNGKPAIEWVMERQSVKTDKKSGIVNDANLWATETMDNAAYPLELLMRVITVSLETNRIVNALPKLDIDSAWIAVQ